MINISLCPTCKFPLTRRDYKNQTNAKGLIRTEIECGNCYSTMSNLLIVRKVGEANYLVNQKEEKKNG